MDFFKNPIEGKREQILNYIVDYFGQEHSDLIRERWMNTQQYFLPKFNDDFLSSIASHYKEESEERQELINQYKDTPFMKIYFDYKNKVKMVENDSSIIDKEKYLKRLFVDAKLQEYSVLDVTAIYKSLKDRNVDTLDFIFSKIFDFSMASKNDGESLTVLSRNGYLNIGIMKDYINLVDEMYVHETVHNISSSCYQYNHDYIKFMGLCSMKCDNKNLDESYNIKHWETPTIFNEVLTDYFAKKIYKKMEADNFKIGFNRHYSSVYLCLFPVLNQFIKENLKSFKNFYITNDLQGIAKYLGGENYNMLLAVINKLFKFLTANTDFYDKLVAQLHITYKDIFYNIFNLGRLCDRSSDQDTQIFFGYIDEIKAVLEAVKEYQSDCDAEKE